MTPWIGEFTGTALLILFGGGVVANVVLPKSNGQQGGWIVITMGWAMAVFLGVYVAVKLGGSGHLNPAVTLAVWATGLFPAEQLIPYFAGQLTGAFTGAVLVWLTYYKHFEEASDPGNIKAVFCTAPAIRSLPHNLLTECIGTFVLMFGALCITPADTKLGTLDALPVSLLVLGIGLSLGGPTGYAINPARDLGPRIAHFFLPIPAKRDSDWSYSWVPVVAPVAGAVAAAFLYKYLVA